MSTAATTTAAVSAISHAAAPKPASPFAQILRRSRFASYDPAIRQTYSSPSANAHRGDWGLKRPIAARRKNAFISLSNFESPAQFTEWNNAENQVRFIRRIDEMGTRPTVLPSTPWDKSLGTAKAQWLLDSDFAPEEDHSLDGGVTQTAAGQPSIDDSRIPETTDLAGLGMRGPGQYGAHRIGSEQRTGIRHLTPNLEAMSRREFVRYLGKLRQLRPAFKAHLENAAHKLPYLRGQTLYDLAQDPAADHHQRFIETQTAEEFKVASSTKIAQQPHPNAAMAYTHTSNLESYFLSKPQPGLILQQNRPSDIPYRFARPIYETTYTASFGGLTALAVRKNVGTKKPLFDFSTEQAINSSAGAVERATASLRPTSGGLVLDTPPRVVGRNAQGLKAVRIVAEVLVDDGTSFGRSNHHRPGSVEYVAQDASHKKQLVDFAVEKHRRFHKAQRNVQRREGGAKNVVGKLNVLLRRGKAQEKAEKEAAEKAEKEAAEKVEKEADAKDVS